MMRRCLSGELELRYPAVRPPQHSASFLLALLWYLIIDKDQALGLGAILNI